MPIGTVKKFDAKTGQGFIAVEGGGADVFVHRSSESRPPLVEGVKVQFETRQGEHGLEAVNVKPVEKT